MIEEVGLGPFEVSKMNSRKLPLAIFILLSLLPILPCRGQLPPELKDRLTFATVYIETQLTLASRDWVALPDEVREQIGQRPSEPASGSGFLITDDGYLITNAHVIEGMSYVMQYDVKTKDMRIHSMQGTVRPKPFNPERPTDPFTLTFNASGIKIVVNSGLEDEKTYTPSVIRVDKEIDLALLKISGTKDFVSIPLDQEFEVESGTRAIMAGFPGGTAPDVIPFLKASNASSLAAKNPRVSINQGSVSSVREHDGEKRYQMAIGANHGNSGGPIINSSGSVIGVLYAGIDQMQNINYAIPTSYIGTVCTSALRSQLGLNETAEGEEPDESDDGEQSFDDFLESSEINFGDN